MIMTLFISSIPIIALIALIVEKEITDEKQKLWVFICIGLLAINAVAFIPTSSERYVTALHYADDYLYYDNVSIPIFMLQILGILGFCFGGYAIQNLSLNSNNTHIPTTNLSNNTSNAQTKTTNHYNYINIQTNNKFALSSFICSIAGYFSLFLGFILGIVSLIFGLLGITTFDYTYEKNKWFAVVGIVLGAFCIIRRILF